MTSSVSWSWPESAARSFAAARLSEVADLEEACRAALPASSRLRALEAQLEGSENRLTRLQEVLASRKRALELAQAAVAKPAPPGALGKS